MPADRAGERARALAITPADAAVAERIAAHVRSLGLDLPILARSTQGRHDEALRAAARKQLQVAELLGYGAKKSFKPMYEQLDEIEKKSTGGKSGKGWFDKLKQQVSDLV